MKTIISFIILLQTNVFAEIKNIYPLNNDFIVEIDISKSIINDDIERDICKLESIKDIKGKIYIKYYNGNNISTKIIYPKECL